MIKVEDLRVGNYLLDEYGEIFQVKQIGTGLIESYGMYIYEIEEIKPVGLTEEILLKCGFKKIDHHRFKIIPSQFEFYYTISVHDNCFRIYVGDSIICANVIFYLHQLQNLYYALCNQELKIKL